MPDPPIVGFRPIHYLGSKLRALPAILNALDRLDPARGPVCDLFAGSGTVAYAAAARRRVIAVDIQEYSRLLCTALAGVGEESFTAAELARRLALGDVHERLSAAAAPLLRIEQEAMEAAAAGDLRLAADLLDAGTIVAEGTLRSTSIGQAHAMVRESLAHSGLGGRASVVLRHYGGTFFSVAQAVAIDAIRALADEPGYRGRTRLMASLMGAMSDCVATVGKQFAQPLRLRDRTGALKPQLRAKLLADRAIDPVHRTASFTARYAALPRAGFGLQAMQMDYAEALPRLRGQVSIVYADPPYTRDHYSRFYHVLETVALSDDPRVSATNLNDGRADSRGGYRRDRHQSPFCIKSQAPFAFVVLAGGAAALGVPLLLSYSDYEPNAGARPRVVSIEEVVAICGRFYGRVELSTLDLFNHSKLNRAAANRRAGGTREVLVSCSGPLR